MLPNDARRVLYVGTRISEREVGGREQLSGLLRRALQASISDEIQIVDLRRAKVTAWTALLAIFRGYVDGISSAVLGRVTSDIQSGSIDTVFLDGSNLGAIAKVVKRAHAGVEVVSFFHNCEARFFLGAFRRKPTLRSLAVMIANWRAEAMAVSHSDRLICLSERDSSMLGGLYGRRGTDILPMAMSREISYHLSLKIAL